MLFDIYKIKSIHLIKYVEYILFNHSNDVSNSKLITSFANTNICLGIISEKKLVNKPEGLKGTETKNGIHSYLSGMYLVPHKFEANGVLDEICIDFTPLGYYRFFKMPLKTYVVDEDVLTEGFGKDARFFFENIFRIPDFQQRGAFIEEYLLGKLLMVNTLFLQECFHYIHTASDELHLKTLAKQMRCSEKKIARSFSAHFDLTPKDYMRIVKFRRALQLINHVSTENLTSIGHRSGYYDQSHFVKDIKFFTGKTPKEIRAKLHNVQEKVIIALD